MMMKSLLLQVSGFYRWVIDSKLDSKLESKLESQLELEDMEIETEKPMVQKNSSYLNT